ncbi:MAG: FAD:protein FMN transferase [Nitrospirota bacterium]
MKKKSKDRFQISNLKSQIYIVFLLFTILCSLGIIFACTPQRDKILRKTKIMMDTIVTITVVSNSRGDANNAIDAAFSEIERLEQLTTFFSAQSEVSQINKNAGISEVKISPDIMDMLDKAMFVSKETDGAFDLTIGCVTALYDFHKKTMPSHDAIKKNLYLVNYKDLVINKNRSTAFLRKKGMLIDLGGVAKGYAVDKAVEALKKRGIKAGIVSVAGDIRVFGSKPEGKTWKMGIRNPRIKEDSLDDIMATIDLKDMAISTSGDYERYFMLNGKRYHHILSPNTGYPAEKCQSVTVVAKDAVFTDAFATGIFILGVEQGMKILEKMGFDGVIVDSKGKIHITPGIRGGIEFKRTY